MSAQALLTTVAVGATYVLAVWLLRGRLSRRLSSAMAEGDYIRYRELVFSKLTDLLIDQNSLCLMRAATLAAEGESQQAEVYLRLIRKERLDTEHLLDYYRTAFSLALHEKDAEKAADVQADLKELFRASRSPMVKQQFQENKINIKLYIQFDSTVIEEISQLMAAQTGHQRGVSCLALAKALHLNNEDIQAKFYLVQARTLLVNTAYLPAIDTALADLGQLD